MQDTVGILIFWIENRPCFHCDFNREQEWWCFVDATFYTHLEIESIEDFEDFLERDADKILKSFTTAHTFNETDQVLQNVKYWPNIATVGYFKTKLKFQIQHSLFR